MEIDPFALSSYQYELPDELIAQQPHVPRDQSRLMIIDRAKGTIEEIKFRELVDLLEAGDSLVFNDTKVIPARLVGQRPNGGRAEILLIKQYSLNTWLVFAKPGKKLREGSWISFGENLKAQIIETREDGSKMIQFEWVTSFHEALAQYGQMPLPPYIKRPEEQKQDHEKYQTVYAKKLGAVAAPTAGLHFTNDMLAELENKKVEKVDVTLHVTAGTFKPVQTEDIRHHPMHAETCIISDEASRMLSKRDLSKRQVCVGTTCCRTLESASDANGNIRSGTYETSIFIYPGYQFKYVRSLLTNFHLPGSTLLMLVSAFAGHELIMEAYAKAVEKRFRFFSYGDAMLIL